MLTRRYVPVSVIDIPTPVSFAATLKKKPFPKSGTSFYNGKKKKVILTGAGRRKISPQVAIPAGSRISAPGVSRKSGRRRTPRREPGYADRRRESRARRARRDRRRLRARNAYFVFWQPVRRAGAAVCTHYPRYYIRCDVRGLPWHCQPGVVALIDCDIVVVLYTQYVMLFTSVLL